MKWDKRGLILKPDTTLWWMKAGYMAVPTAEMIEGDVCRLYFCGRDDQNRSQIGYNEINLNEPSKVLALSREPVLKSGELGAFDDSGVTPTHVETIGDKKCLFYVGWGRSGTVRMSLFTGLALSDDGGKTFARHSRAPILERNVVDPFLTATLSLLREENVWRMWYVSGEKWEQRGAETYPYYNIKYAESRDGIRWMRTGKICIELATNEHALARPCVLKEGGIYKMWYAYKGDDYHIGYAESKNGLEWTRMDSRAGLELTPGGPDAKMMEYPCVISHKGKKHLFYNGDEYGKNGICYAVEE